MHYVWQHFQQEISPGENSVIYQLKIITHYLTSQGQQISFLAALPAQQFAFI